MLFTSAEVGHVAGVVSGGPGDHAALLLAHAVHHGVVLAEPVKLVLLPSDVGPLDDDEDDGAHPQQHADPAPGQGRLDQTVLEDCLNMSELVGKDSKSRLWVMIFALLSKFHLILP